MFPSVTSKLVFLLLCLLLIQAVISYLIGSYFSRKLGVIMPSPNSYALVTGASSGIGADIATQLAKLGYNLIIVARTDTALQKLASELTQKYSIRVLVEVQDLGKHNAANDLYARVLGRLGNECTVDILVNNAGIGSNKYFLDGAVNDYTHMVQLNSVSLMELCYIVGDDMVKRGRGRIMNIGSVTGFSPQPYEAVYGATKAFINSLSRALSFEMSPQGVGVINICPGATWTNFGNISGCDVSWIFRIPGLQAKSKRVAQESVDALLSNRIPCHINPGNYCNTIFSYTNCLLPSWWVMWMSKMLWSPVSKKKEN